MKQKIDSTHIIDLLRARHEQDVFVTECKDGPTHSANHFRMDAWAMTKSWSNPRTIGYEVKVSRSDFLNDTKYQKYLGLCNELYFVSSPGIIKVEELPQEVGLIEVTSTGTRLITKRKAAYRKVDIPESLYRYLLMSRCKISRSEMGVNDDIHGLSFWKQWLVDKDEKSRVGAIVSKQMRILIHGIQKENEELVKKHEKYERLRAYMEAHDLSEWCLDSDDAIQRRLQQHQDKLNQIVPTGFSYNLDQLVVQANRLQERLKELTNP